MCEWASNEYKVPAMALMQSRSLNQIISPQTRAMLPSAMTRGRCPRCGIPLSDRQRNPRGRASRSMCEQCYDFLIVNSINHNCIICGRPLRSDKIEAQQHDRREVGNHFHDGECTCIWTIIHCVANAGPSSQRMNEIGFQPQQRSQLPDFTGANYDPNDIAQIPISELLNQRFQRNQKGQLVPQSHPVAAPGTKLIPRLRKGKPVVLVSNVEDKKGWLGR